MPTNLPCPLGCFYFRTGLRCQGGPAASAERLAVDRWSSAVPHNPAARGQEMRNGPPYCYRSAEAGVVQWWFDIRAIERVRVLRGWTKADLARIAHVDPGTLSDMTLGRRRPTVGTVQAVCHALGLVLSDVIAFDDAAVA